ncbi:glutathione S-transferase family protein [Quisquiliibacterium transsilvanicum]|uniref:Glutathione S-transferase n=1 Tax=Quisquiliibacterium transsilvanicum TaxID=1549638 RepID=A0A7W8M7Y4_9BURK|nr:glutathione S-transferase family protein [Quisquiliibacterium transsilvanicum]MBB5271258.1 glutathione S-transferase [Quisquiliibacterium transsilvanicum]
MTLKIHGIAASRAARPLWLLEELGVPYEHVSQSYLGGATRTPEFLALNPNGHIPVLEDDGIVVWESMATTLYLARKFGGPLAPGNLAEEAEALRWTFWAVTECEKDALSVLMHRVAMPADRRDHAVADQAEGNLARPLAILDAHLATRPYIAGERFTVVDVNVASVLAWAQPSRKLMEANPKLADWLKRCLDRPAHQKVRQLAKTGR